MKMSVAMLAHVFLILASRPVFAVLPPHPRSPPWVSCTALGPSAYLSVWLFIVLLLQGCPAKPCANTLSKHWWLA